MSFTVIAEVQRNKRKIFQNKWALYDIKERLNKGKDVLCSQKERFSTNYSHTHWFILNQGPNGSPHPSLLGTWLTWLTDPKMYEEKQRMKNDQETPEEMSWFVISRFIIKLW